MQAKRLLLWSALAAVVLAAPAAAQQPRWQTTLEGAKRLAGQTNQLVLIHFWAPYCTACRRMEQEVFPDPAVVATIQTYYVPVKINTEYFPATANQFGITSLPTDVILTPQGHVLAKIEGMAKAPDYTSRLGQVATSVRPQSPPAVYAQVPPAQPTQAAGAGYFPAASAFAAPAFASGRATPQGPAYQAAPVAQPIAAANTPAAALPAYAAPAGSAVSPPQTAPLQPGVAVAAGPAPPASPYGARLPDASAPPAGSPPPSSAPDAVPAPGTPQVGLDGFCPVRLAETQKWVLGDRRWGVIHQGRVYLFAGPNEQARFYANPEAYAPVLAGNDVVVALESGQTVPGRREHGVYFGNRIYLFAAEQSLAKFQQQPDRYAGAAQQVLRAASYAPAR